MNIHFNEQYKSSLDPFFKMDLLKTALFSVIIFGVGISTNSGGILISDFIPAISTFIFLGLLWKGDFSDGALIVMFGTIVALLASTSFFYYLSWIKFEALWILNIGVLSLFYIRNRKTAKIFFSICICLCLIIFLYEQLLQSKYGYGGIEIPPNGRLFNFVLFFFFLIDNIVRFYFLITNQSKITDDLKNKSTIEEQYSILFRNSFNPILLYDYNNKRVVDMNDSFNDLVGFTRDELIAQKDDILMQSNIDINDIELKEIQTNRLKTKKSNKEKIIFSKSKFRNKSGEFKYCDLQVLPLHDGSGKAYIICLDKTETILQQAEIEKSRNDYKNIFDNNLLGVVVLDEGSTIKKLNHSFCEMMGYSHDELIGENILKYTNEASVGETMELIDLLRSAKIHSYIQEKSYVRKDNREFQALISVKGIYENGVLVQSVATIQDITHRKEVESSLRNSEEKYREIFDNSLSGLAIIQNGKYKQGNRSFREILSINNDDLKGKSLYDFIHHEDVDYVAQELSEVIEKPNSNKRLIHRIKVGDEVKTIMANLAVKDGSSHDDYFAILNCVDLTEFMEMQSQLNERQAIYEALIDSSFTGIDVIELQANDKGATNSKLVVRNKLMSSYFSTDDNSTAVFTTLDKLMEITPSNLSSGKSSMSVYKSLLDKLDKNKRAETEWGLIIDDKLHDFNVYHQIVNVNGKQLLIRNFLDITERNKKDQIILNQLFELNKKNKELEVYIESNLQLENFAYIASHDLKAPLRTVSSFAYLMKKNSYEKMSPKDKKYLDIIIASSGNMQILIHDLLQFARINSQKVNIKIIDFETFLKRSIQDIYQDIEDYKGVVNYVNIPRTISGDEIKLRQLFQNLIRNGLKFHRKGVSPNITISCEEKKKEFKFSVSDNGIGIEDDKQDKIFGIFSKLHSSDQFEGTGLGLTISKKIVEQHNGNIWLESVFGVGTTFHFTILKDLFIHDVDTEHIQSELNQIS